MNYGLITTIMQNPQFVSPAGRLELGNIGSNPTEKIWLANLTNGCVSRREEGQEACDWISDKREKLLNFESKSKKSRVRLASFHFRFEWDRRRDLCLSDSFHSLIRNSGCVRFFGWRLSKVRIWRARGKKSSYRVFRGCYLRLCPQSNVMRFLFYQIGRGEK